MKVLVISHNSFSQTHNNGKTLSAIFSAFKKEELCQLYFTPVGFPDIERCDSYYLITDKDAIRSILFRGSCGTSSIKNRINSTDTNRRPKVNNFKRFARTIVWLFSSWYKGGLSLWISEQKPDLIFYVGGDSIFSHKIAVSLSRKLNLPLITYFTDDYIINPKNNLYIRCLKKYYSLTIKESKALFAIGKQMADAYTDYYGKVFTPIMNIVPVNEHEPEYKLSSNTITISYFGNLGLGRLDELFRFGSFITNNKEGKIKHELMICIYTFNDVSDEDREKLKNVGIFVCKGVSGSELLESMSNTDIFLHVESIEEKYKLLTMLSVSTKIPEYMSMAKPIIAFGPSEVASFNVIAEASPLLVINDHSDLNNIMEQQITNNLFDVLDNENKLKEIAHSNYLYAKENFDINIVAQDFRKKLEIIRCNN